MKNRSNGEGIGLHHSRESCADGEIRARMVYPHHARERCEHEAVKTWWAACLAAEALDYGMEAATGS